MTGRTSKLSRSRAATAVITAFLIIVLLGFTALAVDISWLVGAKRQEQACVDNTALATAHYIANQPLGSDRHEVSLQATDYGFDFMPVNPVEGIALTPDVVETGVALRENGRDGKVIGFMPENTIYNAVRVFVTMADDRSQSLPSFFGPIFGVDYFEPQAEAIALLKITAGGLIPFTVKREVWDAHLNLADASYQDDWSWDEANGPQQGLGDGIPEVVMYPDKAIECNGDFGALNIGVGSQSLPLLSQQIQFGVSREALEDEIKAAYDIELGTYPWLDEIGQPYLDDEGDPFEFLMGLFVRPNGDLFPVQITGEPGLRVGTPMRAALDLRINTIVGIFIHTQCDYDGSNATYTIPEVRYARLLGYRLRTNDKWIVVQPTDANPNSIIDIEVAGLGK